MVFFDFLSPIFHGPCLFVVASSQSAASEFSSIVASNRCQTPYDPQVASPLPDPGKIPSSITRPQTDALQSLMSFTNTPLRPNITVQLQSDSTPQQTSAGRTSTYSILICVVEAGPS